jgi:hypothetical protein
MHNARSGIVVWGVDTRDNCFYLREARAELYHPEELYNDIFLLAEHYGAQVVGVEVAGLEEYIIHPLTDAMLIRGLRLDIHDLSARMGRGELSGMAGGKKGRARALVPYYRQGQIFHNEANCGPYEQQLLSFPRPKRWDLIDAAAYIIQLVNEGDRFFSLPGHDRCEPTGEEEYAKLVEEDDEPLEDWRIA